MSVHGYAHLPFNQKIETKSTTNKHVYLAYLWKLFKILENFYLLGRGVKTKVTMFCFLRVFMLFIVPWKYFAYICTQKKFWKDALLHPMDQRKNLIYWS